MKTLASTVLVMFFWMAVCQQALGNPSASGKEYMIHLGPPDGSPTSMAAKRFPASQTATAMLQRHVDRPPRRQRSPQLSPTQLVLIAYDEHGSELARVIMPDPRLILAEEVSANGDIGHKTLLRDEVDFPVVLPDYDSIETIRIFHPRWTGSDFVLDLLGSIQLP